MPSQLLNTVLVLLLSLSMNNFVFADEDDDDFDPLQEELLADEEAGGFDAREQLFEEEENEAERFKVRAVPKTWYLKGYLPSNGRSKALIHMHGELIKGVYKDEKDFPDTGDKKVIDVDAWIFPGLMDLHSHLKYNVLPLWSEAKGQWTNRFQWRKLSSYKAAVGKKMKPINASKHSKCAAVRWAEIKALTGGVTTIQGIGQDTQCGRGFGINNVEIRDDLGHGSTIRSRVDLIAPNFRELFDRELSEAVEKYVANAKSSPANFRQAYNKAFAQLEKKRKDEELADLFRKYNTGGFGNPTDIRKGLFKHFDKAEDNVYIVHLSEGARFDKEDNYNDWEFEYAKKTGLLNSGLIAIHAVGFNTKSRMDYVKKSGSSIVWSPFSNILLYGESLNVPLALDAKVNVAFGVDWAPTGGKNILDEFKIARRYIEAKEWDISERKLVTMATLNAAKALKLTEAKKRGPRVYRPCSGQVKENCQADLTLIKKTSRRRAYKQLVDAAQEDVELVVVKGNAVYGSLEPMEAFDREGLEKLPRSVSGSCRRFAKNRKAIRLGSGSDYERVSKTKDLLSVSGIRKELKGKIGDLLDPIFNCQDSDYEEYLDKDVKKLFGI